MKRNGLLASVAAGVVTSPVAAEAPLAVTIVMQDDAAARVTIGEASFVLPDEQEAMVAALRAMPDKARPVAIVVTDNLKTPYRVIGGLLYLMQSAGFTEMELAWIPSRRRSGIRSFGVRSGFRP